MIIKRGFAPLPGERILSVSPPPRQVTSYWQRRLNHFTGRTLTSPALEVEQGVRVGRLNLLGAAMSPGVVAGLETGTRVATQDEAAVYHLEIAPGVGVSTSGEVVCVGSPVDVPLASVRGIPPLGERPRAGILVLQPVELSDFPYGERTGPCEQDPADDAFADWQLVDAACVTWVPWPAAIPMPAPPAEIALWRNLLAWAIFDAEARLEAGRELPWEEFGVPIALLALNARNAPLFLDRSAVVRAGGEPPRSTDMLGNTGTRRLWQARLLQFSEQMGELESALPDTTGRVRAAARQFRYLPPLGLLPRDFIEFTWVPDRGTVVHTPFFPGSFELEGVPVPLEQLDAAVQSAASLAPFDLRTSDELRMMVAVPQAYFEPRLLLAEVMDPAFHKAVADAAARRGEMLLRRNTVRGISTITTAVITGKAQEFPNPDPDQLDPAEQPAGALPEGATPEIDYATRPTTGGVAIWLKHRADLLPLLHTVLGTADAAQREFDTLTSAGLDEAIRILDARASRGNDKIDLGFLRVQSDIYRIRQITLGSTQASRLTTSPTAAGVIKGRTAVATEAKLDQAFKELKKSPVNPATQQTRDMSPMIAVRSIGPSSDEGAAPAGIFFTAADVGLGLGRGMVREAVTARAGVERVAVMETTIGGFVGAGKTDREKAAASAKEVNAASPVVGKADNLSTTVGERLQSPQAVEAWLYAVSTKKEVVTSFQDPVLLGAFDGVEVPGVFDKIDGQTNRVVRKSQTIAETRPEHILAERLAPDTKDEAGVFREGIDVLDRTIAVLRAAEGRVAALNKAVEVCVRTRGALAELLGEIAQRLEAIADQLNEARHDVSVATALRNEEQLRLDTINGNRRRILDRHVAFVAFCRPRTNYALGALPVRALDPEITEAPLAACLSRALEPPADLDRYIDLLRESPVAWFPAIAKLVERLDTRDRLLKVLDSARGRAGRNLPRLIENGKKATAGRFSKAIESVLSAQGKVAAANKNQLARLDLRAYEQYAWKELHAEVRRIVSVSDLIETAEGRPEILAAATRELEQISRAGACLHASFAEVLPALRLDWALRLSEYDEAVSLRSLSVLPRFSELEYLDRHELQSYVDYLFSRVDGERDEAVSSINDLVRIALLLASHAPVTRLITGSVTEAARVPEGGTIHVTVDIAQVRCGIEVNFFKGGNVVARGVVEDLLTEKAAVRLTKSFAGAEPVQIDKDARVHFVEAGASQQSRPAKEIALGGRSKQEALLDAFQSGKR